MKKRNNQPLLILAAGLVLIAMGAVAAFLVLGGGDDDGGTSAPSGALREKTPSASTRGTTGGPEPVVTMTPSKASLLLGELPDNYEVDVTSTFTMTVSTFTSSYWFRSNKEGEEKSAEWKIVDGYQVYFQPKGLAAEVLQGSPYIHIETYQFATIDGAKAAWDYFDGFLSRTPGSEAVEAKPLANESSAYRFIEGTVSVSEDLAVYHRFSYRRGNIIVTVVTWGADKSMNIDPARNVAATIDDKLLGTRPAVEPTPIPTPSFPGLGN